MHNVNRLRDGDYFRFYDNIFLALEVMETLCNESSKSAFLCL